MKLILFGAGNIGRSFIAPLFADAGYRVVFVDINRSVVSALAARGEYPVVTVSDDAPPQTRIVRNVTAIDGNDQDAVTEELKDASLAATAVGKGALAAVARTIVRALPARRASGAGPLDLVLAENARDARAIVEKAAAESDHLPELGLVETSIGKMVPIVPQDEAARDPLIVFSEPYNTLIVDSVGFKGRVPQIREIMAVERIEAYVDRKLFVHNLGHAACAYLSFARQPHVTHIAEAVREPAILALVHAAMREAATGLRSTYPDVFSQDSLHEHIDDLLHRFANGALGDTVHRVGRDLPRKLARDDRVVGAMRMCAAAGTPFETIARVYGAALEFVAPDAAGSPFPADRETVRLIRSHGNEWALTELSGLQARDSADGAVKSVVLQTAQEMP